MVRRNESAFFGQRVVGLRAKVGALEDVAESAVTADKEKWQTKERENCWKEATKDCAPKLTRDVHRHCHPENPMTKSPIRVLMIFMF